MNDMYDMNDIYYVVIKFNLDDYVIDEGFSYW